MKNKFYHLKTVCSLMVLAFFVISCENIKPFLPGHKGNDSDNILKFCTISDPHYLSPKLLINDGEAFQDYQATERKLIAEGPAIFESAIKLIKKEKPKFLIISGDLSKDGEKQSHLEVADYLNELEKNNINVYVCPGIKDINNPIACSYDGNISSPVENISSKEFEDIYAEFGFNEAIERDPHSLSYIVEPEKGIWLMSIDACQYEKNIDTIIEGGKFSEETLSWIKNQLKKAQEQNKMVFGFMNHLLIEHYQGQSILFPQFFIEGWESISEELIELGLKFIFTGHYQAQDITKKEIGGDYLYDVETASLIVFPCPIRIVNIINNEELHITTKQIKDIDYDLGEETNFLDYAFDHFFTVLDTFILMNLTAPPYSVELDEAKMIRPAIKEGAINHECGDEGIPSPIAQSIITNLLSSDNEQYQIVGQGITSLFTDLEPTDNYVFINLEDGEVIPIPFDF